MEPAYIFLLISINQEQNKAKIVTILSECKHSQKAILHGSE